MVVGENVNKIMFTNRWWPYTTRKTNWSLPDSRHLKLTLSKLEKTFWHILLFLLIIKWQNLLIVVITYRSFMKGSNFLIVLVIQNIWTYYADHRALFVTAGLMFGRIVRFHSHWNSFFRYFGTHQWSLPITKG